MRGWGPSPGGATANSTGLSARGLCCEKNSTPRRGEGATITPSSVTLTNPKDEFMFRIVVVAAVWFAAASSLPAQRPARRSSDRPRGLPSFAVMQALDSNGDGKLTANELDQAVAALKTLDKDRDGKLSAAEIGWPPQDLFRGRAAPIGGGPPGFGGGPPGFGGGPPGFGGGPPGFGGWTRTRRGERGRGGFGGRQRPVRPDPDNPTSEPPAFGRDRIGAPADRRGRPGGTDSLPRTGRTFFSIRLLQGLDRDRDGTITESEIPARMRKFVLDRLDTDKSGVIDAAELEAEKKRQAEAGREPATGDGSN